MTCFGPWWWIFPLVFLGMLFLLPLGWRRRGRRRWCYPARRGGEDTARLDGLEQEVRGLKQKLADLGVFAPYR